MTEDKNQAFTTTAQQRSATLVTLLTFGLTTMIALITLLFVPPADKTPIDNFAMPFIAIASGTGYMFARRGRHELGVYLLLGAVGVVSISYPLAADNIGWQTAIGMLLITTSIANGALPEKTAGRVSAGAFGFAIAIILVELFTTGVVANPMTSSSIIVTGLLAAIYLGLIYYRFRQFGLRTKFIIVFIVTSLISVSATTLAISRLVLDQLNEKLEQQLTGVSNLTAISISQELTAQVNLIQAVALSDSILEFLERLDGAASAAEIQKRDEQWRTADAAGNNFDPVVRSTLENDVADMLQDVQRNFPAHVEIFITDVQGANVAATNRTSDYYQADEEWWQVAYANGTGAIYISQPTFDESSQSLSLQISAPIISETTGEILGIIRSTLDLNILIPSFELGRFGETGRTEIYMPDGLELELHFEDGKSIFETETAPQDFLNALAAQPGEHFLDTSHEGSPVMVGISNVAPSGSIDPDIAGALQTLNWRVMALQDRSEALQTIADTTRASQLVGLASLVLASLIAVGITQLLTKPIVQLTKAAEEISAGKFNVTASVESPDEVGALAVSFNRMTRQLGDTLANLEGRIAERTVDLEMARRYSEIRANQALAIGEISKIINTEQELDILLPLITRLVSERFGFYHTGIFLIDDSRRYAVLQAANSPGGQVMLKRGHSLKVGESGIVGFVAKSGAPRIALDVGQDAVFFNNPDLPTTRSEASLPLKVRGEIIGILDVQSEKPGAFTADDINVLSILADQVAIAIENARLFEQTQQALQEARLAYQQTLREGWKNIGEEEDTIGFYQGTGGGRKLTRPMNTDEINQAMLRSEAQVFHADGKTGEPTLVVPIKLRDQIIGVLHVKSPSRERQWTASEIDLTEAVSERLSLALENARLIQESQRKAIKEQTITEITGRIGSSINLENVLLTAVEELGKTIPGSEVTIKLKNEDGKNGNQ